MTAIRRIVVGVDGAAPGWHALTWAAGEAAATGSRVAVYRVYRDQAALAGPAVPVATLPRTETALAERVTALRDRLGTHMVELRTPIGEPAEQLLAAGGDLLVVGAPEAPARLSSLATPRRVAAHARVPVVVVRPVQGGGLFAGHVVVGVDGSEPARAALAFGFGYAAEHGLPLAAVYASGHHADQLPGDVWVDDRWAETHLAPAPSALTLLDIEVEPFHLTSPWVPVKRAVYRGGAVPALLRAAGGAKLLVVGDRGRGATSRLLLGSVSQGTVAHATGPVAVVHAGPPGAVR